ncbi:helix-turn-helix transcriptional regulator [Pelomonas sp. KK5]|uniref:helix-turn-helix transcriptional regulator n=1 Tax=Pelomonas sp. KK5 TaxID=1855730 RepID=UPI00097C7515|nr:helix-turn-helix transcriptional regulator [Pelomonas sp. KK5]
MTTDLAPLGSYLRNRRTRLDPTAFGYSTERRRTPGLRREEVAQRANISPTWYTWLEQGRGGAPSAAVLNRLAESLMLTELERQHLFMLALGRPPEIRYRAVSGITQRLQRVLDAFATSAAIVKTMTWDVLAWNRVAAVLLTDYGLLEPRERNILRLMFGRSEVRRAQEDWDKVARVVVGAFRADVTRAGMSEEASRLIEELSRTSAEFKALWADTEVTGMSEGTKRLHHPRAGVVQLDFSTFAVDGRPELAMVVFNPAGPRDVRKVQQLLSG